MAFDFASVQSPFRMQPGLRRLAQGAQQLTPACPNSPHVREKLQALREAPHTVLGCATGFDPKPAVQALIDHAVAERPEALGRVGSGIEAYQLGWAVDGDQAMGSGPIEVGNCLRQLDPEWRTAALLCLAFEEDFAIVHSATTRIPWLAVALPSQWAPEEKVGLPFAELHSPVADNARLLAASAHLTQLVTAPQRWERFVWTITPDARLRLHPAREKPSHWPQDLAPEDSNPAITFRTERQTFIPVPEHGQAVFTIHVQCAPLATALARREDAQAVHDALATMSPAVLAYRGFTAVREPLLAWLASRCAA